MECSLWSLGTVKLNFEKWTSTLQYYMIQRKCGHVNQPRFCPLLVQFFPSELHFFSWCWILDDVNQIQTYLQIAGVCLEQCTVKYQALKLFEDKCRNFGVGYLLCNNKMLGKRHLHKQKKNQILKKSARKNDERWSHIARNQNSNVQYSNHLCQELVTCSQAMDQMMSCSLSFSHFFPWYFRKSTWEVEIFWPQRHV